MGRSHDRMPAILPEGDYNAWLGAKPAELATVKALLRPFPSGLMRLWRVGQKASKWRNDDPSIL